MAILGCRYVVSLRSIRLHIFWCFLRKSADRKARPGGLRSGGFRLIRLKIVLTYAADDGLGARLAPRGNTPSERQI
jgi:hypothetical protein